MSDTPTLILVILDESGSMSTKRADVIGGFNNLLTEQKANPAPCRLMVTKFNTVCTDQPVAALAAIAPLNDTTYTPGGNTALYDAIAATVRRADAEKKGDERVLCLIMTDGEENSSRETTFDQVKALIEARGGQGWTFLYIGEQPEKWARMTGSPIGTTAQYQHHAPKQSFMAAATATSMYRADPRQATHDLMARAQAVA